METALLVYVIVLLCWVVGVTYSYRQNEQNIRETPQWLIFFACVIWPISLLLLIISIFTDKPKKN